MISHPQCGSETNPVKGCLLTKEISQRVQPRSEPIVAKRASLTVRISLSWTFGFRWTNSDGAGSVLGTVAGGRDIVFCSYTLAAAQKRQPTNRCAAVQLTTSPLQTRHPNNLISS